MADNGEPSAPKAIASLAKKPSDVTRQGTQKLKFVPTLPARRKKEEVKQETSRTSVQPSDKNDGKGRGRGKSRGEGRGAAPRPPPVEMTASGPFAMGPALAGTSARRSTPRSGFAPTVPQGPAKGSGLGTSLSHSAAPTLKKDKQRENALVDLAQQPKNESDEEVYSEPDEGVKIIDMDNVRQLDWMAPDTLQRERRDKRKKQQAKREAQEILLPPQEPSTEGMDHSNVLDLSGSEDDDLEDLVEDFAGQTGIAEGIRPERLYFFQFPEPFPTFASRPESLGEMEVDTTEPGPSTRKRKVSFAADVKPPAIPTAQASTKGHETTPRVDGVIGHLEVYKSGAVKMRLGNGILLNVSEATRPSFLHQVVHLDMESKKLHVLGEISKRFVVSPDLDALLAAMELAGASDTVLDDANLIKMDAV